jgi:hypothetical protein
MIARSALVFPWLAPKIPSAQLCRRFLKISLLTVATQDQQRGRSGALACWTRDTMHLPNSRAPRGRAADNTASRRASETPNEKANRESDRAKMSGVRRDWIANGGAASADEPKNLSCTVQ